MSESCELDNGQSGPVIDINEQPQPQTQSNLSYVKDRLDTTLEWIYEKYAEHPRSRGLTPFQHFCTAIKFSGMCMTAGVMMLIHAVAPWWFQVAGGDLLITAATLLQEDRDEWNRKQSASSQTKSSEPTASTPVTLETTTTSPEVFVDETPDDKQHPVIDFNELEQDTYSEWVPPAEVNMVPLPEDFVPAVWTPPNDETNEDDFIPAVGEF